MSAIEVLKREKEYMKLHCGSISNGQWIPRDLRLAFDEALLALEQKEKLSKWLDDVEGFETKEFRDTLEKSLFGKLVGTCKVREIMNLKKDRVGEQK
jgi:hypothetical protein